MLLLTTASTSGYKIGSQIIEGDRYISVIVTEPIMQLPLTIVYFSEQPQSAPTVAETCEGAWVSGYETSPTRTLLHLNGRMEQPSGYFLLDQ